MTIISGSYNGRELALMREPDNQAIQQAWDAHPVRLTEDQAAILGVETGISILENRVVAPTTLANLQPHQVQSQLLEQIDNEFKLAIASYKKKLNAATAFDLEEHSKVKKQFNVLEDYPLIARIFMEIVGEKFVDRDSFDRKVQFARQAWFKEVATAEKGRLKSVQDQMKAALVLKARQFKVSTQMIDKHAMEAWQLTQVYEALFPKDVNKDIAEIKKSLPDNTTMRARLLV